MHFKHNYKIELNKPKMIARNIDSGAYVDGTSRFEMKYFLTDR